MRELSYHKGLKNGQEILWNANGTLRQQLFYKNNKLHGLCTWFAPWSNMIDLFNNRCLLILTQRFYLDGESILPISDSTTERCITELVGGKEPFYNKEHDLWVEWDRNQTKFWVGKKQEGKKSGQWILYSATGAMLEAVYYQDGVKLQ